MNRRTEVLVWIVIAIKAEQDRNEHNLQKNKTTMLATMYDK